VWSRPALDRQTRSLQVVAMLAALGGRSGPLRSHINGALNHGATPEQVVETLRMVAVYAGFPAALEAWPVMEEVFAARNIPRPARGDV
jgi:4-carboxymuconolactone decarboxylase